MATLKEMTVSYSASMKIILPHNKFESASVHITRGETFEITPEDDADALYKERFFALQTEIGDLVVQKYESVKNGEL